MDLTPTRPESLGFYSIEQYQFHTACGHDVRPIVIDKQFIPSPDGVMAWLSRRSIPVMLIAAFAIGFFVMGSV